MQQAIDEAAIYFSNFYATREYLKGNSGKYSKKLMKIKIAAIPASPA